MMRRLSSVKRVGGVLRLLRVSSVVGWLVMRLVFCRLMRVRKSLMLFIVVILMYCGIVLIKVVCIFVMVRRRKRMFLMKIVVSVVC